MHLSAILTTLGNLYGVFRFLGYKLHFKNDDNNYTKARDICGIWMTKIVNGWIWKVFISATLYNVTYK